MPVIKASATPTFEIPGLQVLGLARLAGARPSPASGIRGRVGGGGGGGGVGGGGGGGFDAVTWPAPGRRAAGKNDRSPS